MFQHILLAVDLSSMTETVAKKAKAIADNFNAKLSIIHVIEYFPLPYANSSLSLSIDTKIIDVLKKNAKEALAKLAVQFNIPESQCYLEIDSIRHAVTRLATKLNADLIVVGSYSKHGVDKILGSSANAILHTAQCNVLAIRINN
jgi:universal stress protein A